MCSFCCISFFFLLLLLLLYFFSIAICLGSFSFDGRILTDILVLANAHRRLFFAHSLSVVCSPSILQFARPLLPLVSPLLIFFLLSSRSSPFDVVSICTTRCECCIKVFAFIIIGELPFKSSCFEWMFVLHAIVFGSVCEWMGEWMSERIRVCVCVNPQGFKSCSIRFQAFLPPGAKWLNDTSCSCFNKNYHFLFHSLTLTHTYIILLFSRPYCNVNSTNTDLITQVKRFGSNVNV